MGVSKTSDHMQIKIKMLNSSQEPPASSKGPNLDLQDMDVLFPFRMIESQNWEHACIKDQWPYPNLDQDAKLQSGTSCILQCPKSGLKGHWCSLHLQNQDREPKFRSWLYQKSVTISKSGSRCQPPVRNLQWPLKLKAGLKGHECSLHHQFQEKKLKFETWMYQIPVTIKRA